MTEEQFVPWKTATAESLERMSWEEREEARIAPLARQGACPVCRIELPASGECDDHGRPQ
jgi:DNA repair exonuclease SbcCD ATPase subunit